jgi:hypothetical protein
LLAAAHEIPGEAGLLAERGDVARSNGGELRDAKLDGRAFDRRLPARQHREHPELIAAPRGCQVQAVRDAEVD